MANNAVGLFFMAKLNGQAVVVKVKSRAQYMLTN